MTPRYHLHRDGERWYATDDAGRRSRSYPDEAGLLAAIQAVTGWWSVSVTRYADGEFATERIRPRVDRALARKASEAVRRELDGPEHTSGYVRVITRDP